MTGVTTELADVLAAVRSRVDYLRAVTEAPAADEDGWYDCDALPAAALGSVIDAATGEEGDRQVTASLLAQSYAHRVGAVSLAAYAVGLRWPAPTSAVTSVRLAGGKAKALRFRDATLGEPDDAAGLADALYASHLVPFVAAIREAQRLGERLLWANIAASSTSAFRSVEGAARDRGDNKEQAAIRRRADAFLAAAPWLEGTGAFDPDSADWGWQRSACCLWYRTSGGRTCEGCSLDRQEQS